jgi:hypothetical protein
VGITISADDPRSIRAIELAADAGKWRRTHTADGQDAFGVPSQSEAGRYYVVTRSTCTCADFLRGGTAPAPEDDAGAPRACKHILAVRLHQELVKAQQHEPAPTPQGRRGHLSVVRGS